MSERWIAILLALFLGGLGAHKFYTNRVFQGALYFIFLETGVPILLSLIDAARYLFMSDAEFHARYK